MEAKKKNRPVDAAKVARTLTSFLVGENMSFSDLVKHRQSVDLERLFFGHEGTDSEDEGDDEKEVQGDEKKEKKPKEDKEKEKTEKKVEKEKDEKVEEKTSVPVGKESSKRNETVKKLKDEEDGERKSSDTSSGVADLSNDQQSSADRRRRAAHGSHGPQGHRGGRGGFLEDDRDRRISIGWEKLQVLHSRNKLHSDRHGDDDDRGSHSRHGHRGGKKSKNKKDKRVKTALRRLLNERLFGSSNKKKSRRDDDTTESWTNSDSADNNHRGRHGYGKVGADGQGVPDSADDQNSKRRVRLAFGPGHHRQSDDPNAADDENEENGGTAGQEQGRASTRLGNVLPPLRTHQLPALRVFTPAHYPKWNIYVTASQRNMLVKGLERDKSFLSRNQARSAWSSRGDTISTSLSSRSLETGRGGTAAEDETALDPHRPYSESVLSIAGSEAQWATKRKAKPAQDGEVCRSVTFTESSGRSPMDYDDRRLRKLLEELYKDKKFMDKLINKIDEEHLEFPDHIAADDVKFLSEFGRRYLLERADYWDMNGPLGPPRAPQSALGARLARSQASSTVPQPHPDSTGEEVASPRPYTVR